FFGNRRPSLGVLHVYIVERWDRSLERRRRLSLNALVKRRIREGALTVRLPWGETIEAGDGSGPPVSVSITSARALAHLAANPEVALGELYMDGALRFEAGEIWDLADL